MQNPCISKLCSTSYHQRENQCWLETNCQLTRFIRPNCSFEFRGQSLSLNFKPEIVWYFNKNNVSQRFYEPVRTTLYENILPTLVQRCCQCFRRFLLNTSLVHFYKARIRRLIILRLAIELKFLSGLFSDKISHSIRERFDNVMST